MTAKPTVQLPWLIACEFSQTVTKAFRDAGIEAYSCDVLPTEGNPEWHIQGDALEVAYSGKWGGMVAHPPCTYLTIAGAAYYKDEERAAKRLEAVVFFMALQKAPIPRIAIENPVPFNSVMEHVGRYHQKVNPFEFGEPYRKGICLWLNNLPPLFATEIVKVEPAGYCVRKSGKRAGKKYNYYFHQGKTAHTRSRFFPGVAKAMAQQWGNA